MISSGTMQWRSIRGSPMLSVPFHTSLGTRTPTQIVQTIRGGRVTDLLKFSDQYSIEASGTLIPLDCKAPTLHFFVEYDEEIIRNQFGSVICKRPVVDRQAEYMQRYSGPVRVLYYTDAPRLYLLLEQVDHVNQII